MRQKDIKWGNLIIRIIMVAFIIFSILFISPETRENASNYRSTQLIEVKITEDEIEKSYYKDYKGKITIAADYGYAISTTSNIAKGKLVKYYDDKGKPISRQGGFYGLLREFDGKGNIIRITYLDANDCPVLIKNGYASEERTYNDNCQIITVKYIDDEGNPVWTPAYGYGKINDYDENGLNYKTTYVDANGQPTMTNLGYASVVRQYYSSDGMDNGRVENEFYYDEHDEPVALTLGQYGLHKEYNELGQGITLTFLDAEGNPIATNKGYTTIVRTFKPDNNVATEQYYDLQGEPFSLPEGQYGVKKEDGQTVYLNQDGKEIFNFKNLLYNQSWIVIPLALSSIIISSLADRKWNKVFLLLSICVMAYLTLLFRDGNEAKKTELLWHYKKIIADSIARADIIKNIWLFIPFGAILYQIYPNAKMLLIPVVLSMVIEGIQYFFGVGFCEIDDIINNSVGGCIGYFASKLTTDIIARIKSWKHIHIE